MFGEDMWTVPCGYESQILIYGIMWHGSATMDFCQQKKGQISVGSSMMADPSSHPLLTNGIGS